MSPSPIKLEPFGEEVMTQTHTEERPHTTEGEGGHRRSRREASGAVDCQHLDLGLLASRTLRKPISTVHTTQFTILGYGSHRN